uniref:Uncharacterized protein n=1 Tax=Lepeophtheirus salmonis TaxID=72036 RepID=A0A0K2U4S0_LEPSM
MMAESLSCSLPVSIMQDNFFELWQLSFSSSSSRPLLRLLSSCRPSS